MKQKIIAIVGMPGAGKSEAAKFFKEKNIPTIRFGDQVEIGVKEAGKPLTQDNERWYREKLRAELGMEAMAIKAYERLLINYKKAPIVVFDGLYSWEEYVFLIKKLPNLTLLCIYAQPTIRYQRLKSRPIRPLTPKKARERDIAELEKLNKGGPIAIADYLIKNETSFKDFEKQLSFFLQNYS